MGLFFKSVPNTAVTAYSAPVAPAISGLFTPSTLATATFHDPASSDFPVTVDEALSVPAVGRAIQLYTSIISRLPLRGPAWLYETTGAVTPQLRLAATVADLILIGGSVWTVTRDDAGFVDYAERVTPERWRIDENGAIVIDNKKAPSASVIYIASLMPRGFLTAGRASVRHYSNIANTINNRSSVPEPAVIIEQTDTFNGTEEEIDQTIERLAEVLQSRRGGIVYQPQGVNIRSFGGSDSSNQMMIEARMAVRTDLANHLGINAALLDGSTGSNDVYSNALQSRNELLEFSIKTYAEPIADRLNQPDVTSPAERVHFDYSGFDSIADGAGNTGAPRPTNELNEGNAND